MGAYQGLRKALWELVGRLLEHIRVSVELARSLSGDVHKLIYQKSKTCPELVISLSGVGCGA